MKRSLFLTLTLILAACASARAERIESLATIKGTYPIKARGMGLVTGLNGTGDKKDVVLKMLKEVFDKQNINVDAKDLASKNAAVVEVTMDIPAFARAGAQLPVRVASTGGDATSLANGRLMRTFLMINDKEVYAVAEGRVIIGGETENTRFPTTGAVPDGAHLIRSREMDFISADNTIELQLKQHSFTNAHLIASKINGDSTVNPRLAEQETNRGFNSLTEETEGPAQALDAGTVIVEIPPAYLAQKTRYISAIMKNIDVPVDVPPRVVINSTTNDVVITGEVTVGRVAIAHGNLAVTVERPDGKQGVQLLQQKVENRGVIEMSESIGQSENIQVLINTLNAMKATPRDIAVIIQNIDLAGALHAELIVE